MSVFVSIYVWKNVNQVLHVHAFKVNRSIITLRVLCFLRLRQKVTKISSYFNALEYVRSRGKKELLR